MATDRDKSLDLWWRYQYLRDHGHLQYAKKARECEAFFRGEQWTHEDRELLRAQRRPALTFNTTLAAIAAIAGDQILNRTEVSFRPRKGGATEEVADALTKVFMQISDNNQLPWVRTDVYMDGLITSRGFYDVRLEFNDSLQGDARIRSLNPKNVLIDSDASSYDPEGWSDVFVTKWLNLDEIEAIYGKKWRRELENQASTMHPYEYDVSDWDRDQFGTPPNEAAGTGWSQMDKSTQPVLRVVRVLERQWRRLDTREHFVHLPTGEIRPIPDHWKHNDVSAFLQQNDEYSTVRRTLPRVRWTVGAGTSILHDEWSPYEHFTVVPFFPYFRHGKTVGVVENMLGAQELLNKTNSQELHVINTTANSGWKIRSGSLNNMSMAELEERGAQTGLVLELDDINDAEKIQPNQVPTGLDRVSFKAEEYMKKIAGLPDAVTGFAREDVSAKALRANQARASANYALVQDNLGRTDHFMARALLKLVQTYYTEERMMYITTDPLRQRTEPFTVNAITPEGEIQRDLTLGEYDIVITSQPERDTLEESTFAQAIEMRKELGVAIPDDVLIQTSRIPNKKDVLEAINAERNSEEARAAREIEQKQRMAEVEKILADADRDRADSEAKRVKSRKELVMSQHAIDPDTQLRVQADLTIAKMKIEAEDRRHDAKLANEFRIARLQAESRTKEDKE